MFFAATLAQRDRKAKADNGMAVTDSMGNEIEPGRMNVELPRYMYTLFGALTNKRWHKHLSGREPRARHTRAFDLSG